VAIDLPGHGCDPTPPDRVTLRDYAARASSFISDQNEALFVVGHSMGGLVISQAAEMDPSSIRGLIYLCAYLPRNGQSLGELASRDEQTLVAGFLEIDSETGLSTIPRDLARRAFYQDCSSQELRWATEQLGPEPFDAFAETVSLSDERFGSIPRAYIHCEFDAVIGPTLQREMEAASPCQVTVSMQAGHSPFLSAPEELALHLEAIAAQLEGSS
jgi:pimeloyl-ACP methyl ester carboxylesterase